MDKREKGRQFEDYIAKLLSERGWVVHKARRVAKQIRDIKTGRVFWVSVKTDIFGAFDGIACHKEKDFIIFYQATLHPAIEKRIRKIEKIPLPNSCLAIIFQKKDREIRILDKTGKEIGRIKRRNFYYLDSNPIF